MLETTFMERLDDILNGLPEWEIVDVWNNYCESNRYTDEIIMPNDIDDILSGLKPSEVLNAIDLEEYSVNDEFIKETIYGIKSFNYAVDHIDFDDLKEYIFENLDDLGNSDIEDLIDEFEEELEEDDEE